MKDILEEIVAHKRTEVERMKQLLSDNRLYTCPTLYEQGAEKLRDRHYC